MDKVCDKDKQCFEGDKDHKDKNSNIKTPPKISQNTTRIDKQMRYRSVQSFNLIKIKRHNYTIKYLFISYIKDKDMCDVLKIIEYCTQG
jgi:hypothetical protein